jgi:GT2 family glycosyltransferase
MDKIAIIIPVHNRKKTTLCCLEQFQKIASNFDYQIIVIDDGSTDGTSEIINKEYPEVVVLKGNGDLWWGGAINKGFEYVLDNSFDYIYITNDDIKRCFNTLQNLYNRTIKNRLSVFASVAVDPETNIITGGGYNICGKFKKFKIQLKGKKYNSALNSIIEADTLTTMSTLIPIEVVKNVGLFDFENFPHNYSDFEYFIRAKKMGYRLYVDLKSVIYTKGSGSNFHQLIVTKDIGSLVKSFTDTRYGYNLNTVYKSSVIGERCLIGNLIFIRRMCPYCIWLMLSIILPKTTLIYLLKSSGRL